MTLRRVDYVLGGHTASINVVRWGGVGQGVLYTAGSDRVVRVWNADGVSFLSYVFLDFRVLSLFSREVYSTCSRITHTG